MSIIAFIGAGNMASAMIEGLIADHTPPQDLICLGGSGQTAATLAASHACSAYAAAASAPPPIS